MAGLLLHESLALVIYGCLHVCLSFILIPKSCIKCPQQSKVVSTASGFSTPFSINMLSHALGLGLNTYGLRFIVKDLIEAKLLQKNNDCTSVMCMFSLVVSYNLFFSVHPLHFYTGGNRVCFRTCEIIWSKGHAQDSRALRWVP